MNSNSSEAGYFSELLVMLRKFGWLYDVSLTKILTDQSLNKIPIHWLIILNRLNSRQLNNFVTKLNTKINWPTSLMEFRNSCQKLNVMESSTISLLSTKLPKIFMLNLNLKKQHEVLHFSRLIHENCLMQDISVIVDFGTGLGYVCQLLNYLYGYKILALDSNRQHIEKAKFRQRHFFPLSFSSIKYTCVEVNKDSVELIESTLKKEFNEKKKICMIGLHACGDLGVDVSKIYLNMEIAKLLVLVPCCYHKLSLKETNENHLHRTKEKYFRYFPLSNVITNAVELLCVDQKSLLGRPFMRLASQETSDRWFVMDKESHDKHSLNILSRAVLELYAAENGDKLEKLVRKGTRKSQCSNFENYLQDSMLRYRYRKVDNRSSIIQISSKRDLEGNMLSLWKKNNRKLKSTEAYAALQMVLQNLAESLVLIDRRQFLKEQNFNATLFPFVNRSLSPRCFALISNKIN